MDLLHISVAEIDEKIICPEFWRNSFVYLLTREQLLPQINSCDVE